MNKKQIALLVALVVPALATPMRAEFVASMTQVGPDVIVTGSGVINLPAGFNTFGMNRVYSPELVPDRAQIYLGGFGTVVIGPAISGPSSIGPGPIPPFFDVPSLASGDAVGLVGSSGAALLIPYQYHSGSPLTVSDTFFGRTLSNMGVTEGTYTWSWQIDSQNSDSFTLNIGAAVPEPSSVLLIGVATGGICMGALLQSARRRRAR